MNQDSKPVFELSAKSLTDDRLGYRVAHRQVIVRLALKGDVLQLKRAISKLESRCADRQGFQRVVNGANGAINRFDHTKVCLPEERPEDLVVWIIDGVAMVYYIFDSHKGQSSSSIIC